MAETKKTTKKVAETETEKETKPAAKKSAAKKTTSTAKKTTTKKASAKVEEKVEKVEEVEKVEKAPKAKKAVKEEAKEAKKEAKTAKKAQKEVAKKPAKPTVTEAHAKALNVKVTPRKARLVINLVRGKDCDEALGILYNVNRRASRPVAKVIASAMANATNNFNMNEDKLYVASIQASDGVKMRRYLPRAKGSASGMVKRFCNIYVTVKERN